MSLVLNPAEECPAAPDAFIRRGHFEVARPFLSLESDACRLLFSQVIIINVIVDPGRDVFTYTAIADFFAPVQSMALAPLYRPIITLNPPHVVPRYSINWLGGQC